MLTLIKCDCVNPYQDEKYGKNKRIHNPKGTIHIPEKIADRIKEGERINLPDDQYRCSICRRIKTVYKGVVYEETSCETDRCG
jgi:hypothetical protein